MEFGGNLEKRRDNGEKLCTQRFVATIQQLQQRDHRASTAYQQFFQSYWQITQEKRKY